MLYAMLSIGVKVKVKEKVMKSLRKFHVQFREKLRKLRLKQNYGCLIKEKRGVIYFSIQSR